MKYLREREEEDRAGKFVKYHKRAEQIDKRSRVLFKNEEERSVFEEVFDRQTLMTVYRLVNEGAFNYLNGVISAGKESRVYWGVTSDGMDVAVKIYLAASSEFKRRLPYVMGDPRFKKIKRGSRNIAELWARKEFTNLKQCYEAGVRVPKPLSSSGNVVVMEFIGREGLPASKLVDVEASKADYLAIVRALNQIHSKAELVHADLSEYNIMKLDQTLVIFDFGSAVSVEHPLADEFLRRDIANLNRFFQKRGISTFSDEEAFKRVKKGGRAQKDEL